MKEKFFISGLDLWTIMKKGENYEHTQISLKRAPAASRLRGGSVTKA
jgi:hypothetical protein